MITVDMEEPRATRPWAQRAIAVASAALFVASVVGLVTVRPGKTVPTPEAQLADVRAFIHGHPTAHFAATEVMEFGSATGDVGNHSEDRSKADGVISLPDRAHWTEDSGDSASELIRMPDAFYSRDADKREGLASEQWVMHKIRDAGADAAITADVAPDAAGAGFVAAGVASAFGAPQEFAKLFTVLKDLTRVDPRTIRGTVDIASLPGVAKLLEEGKVKADEVPTITVEITSEDGGQLDRLSVASASKDTTPNDEKFSDRSDITFTAWGDHVTIAAPAADTIDPTPNVDEKAMSEFNAAPILVPGNMPASFKLLDASTTLPEGPDDTTCPEADLSYGDPAALSADPESTNQPTLDITITKPDCEDYAIDDGAPITIAGHRGEIKHGNPNKPDEDYAVSIDVVIGSTRFHVDSDLPQAVVLSALKTVVPFNMATAPVFVGELPGG